ncbi:hypothetical protein HX99_01110 [Peptococcaceae bacterium SCADC1_2_3]|jgi:hypothetical protein|nr:hypothetical protein DK28_0203825 [Peptococcaceae bacterium SCADC1_2_3]KFI34626.1 hypothetical protein HX99_01110 [Peptococcaceae bacterium SCADC1_2_3]KFI34944.1 hypothetical protein HY00_08350 [Peptococcaceae bacterium SCADC1_2_3]KFI36457.1 hypothetical protein HY02_01505 [Peptococcaceae bacterium SCADC1_2_3]
MFEVIDFSVHLLLKIEILKSHDINISKEIIEDIVRFPDKIEMGYKGRQIAQKGFDETHVLRVIYETKPEKILVITVYPGRRSRYEKD